MIKIIGMCAVILAGVFVTKRFSSYQDRRLSECEGFLALLGHLSRELTCFSRPIAESLGSFSNEALDRVGFLSELARTEDFGRAFLACAPRRSVGEDAKRILGAFSSEFGHGYRNEELRAIAGVREELERLLAAEHRQVPRQKRLVRTLVISASAGFVILLL